MDLQCPCGEGQWTAVWSELKQICTDKTNELEDRERHLRNRANDADAYAVSRDDCMCGSSPQSRQRSANIPDTLSLNSIDVEYMSKIVDLVKREKYMKKNIENLERQEHAYQEVLRGFENNSQACKCNDKDDLKLEVENMNRELQKENRLLRNDLDDIRLELKQCLERIEGPMQHQLEREKLKSSKLEKQLQLAAEAMNTSQNCFLREMNNMKLQLATAISNAADLSNTNDVLKRKLCSLDGKCADLEDDLAKQKVNEAETINRITRSMRRQQDSTASNAKDNVCICPTPKSGQGDECGDLYTVARRLSKSLKETAPCEECSKLPRDLVDTAHGLKNIADMMQGKKKTGKQDCSCQLDATQSTACQCDIEKRKGATVEGKSESKVSAVASRGQDSIEEGLAGRYEANSTDKSISEHESKNKRSGDRSRDKLSEDNSRDKMSGGRSRDKTSESKSSTLEIKSSTSVKQSKDSLQVASKFDTKMSGTSKSSAKTSESGDRLSKSSSKGSRKSKSKSSKESSRASNRPSEDAMSKSSPRTSATSVESTATSSKRSKGTSKHDTSGKSSTTVLDKSNSSMRPSSKTSSRSSKKSIKSRSKASLSEPSSRATSGKSSLSSIQNGYEVEHGVVVREKDDVVKVKSSTSVKRMGDEVAEPPFDVETKVDVLDQPPDGIHIITTVTGSGTLEVITESPTGVIETSLVYTESGKIEVVTEMTNFEDVDIEESGDKSASTIEKGDVTDKSELSDVDSRPSHTSEATDVTDATLVTSATMSTVASEGVPSEAASKGAACDLSELRSKSVNINEDVFVYSEESGLATESLKEKVSTDLPSEPTAAITEDVSASVPLPPEGILPRAEVDVATEGLGEQADHTLPESDTLPTPDTTGRETSQPARDEGKLGLDQKPPTSGYHIAAEPDNIEADAAELTEEGKLPTEHADSIKDARLVTEEFKPTEGETIEEYKPTEGETTEEFKLMGGETAEEFKPMEKATPEGTKPTDGEFDEELKPTEAETAEESKDKQEAQDISIAVTSVVSSQPDMVSSLTKIQVSVGDEKDMEAEEQDQGAPGTPTDKPQLLDSPNIHVPTTFQPQSVTLEPGKGEDACEETRAPDPFQYETISQSTFQENAENMKPVSCSVVKANQANSQFDEKNFKRTTRLATSNLPETSTEQNEQDIHYDFSDFSDVDPNYAPSDNESSDDSITQSAGAPSCRKRKFQLKEKTCRKRLRNTEEWIDKKAKRELNLGVEHKNRKGTVIQAKLMKPPCKEKCRKRCSLRINQEMRERIFQDFWKIGDHARQWDYIARFVKQTDKKQERSRRNEAHISRRNFSRNYMLCVNNKETEVCKVMFLNTFGISEQWVTTALGKIGDTGNLEEDRRGKHHVRPHRISDGLKDEIRNHINLFPLVPSHYNRKNSKKMYLEDNLNISKMHRMYEEYMKEKGKIEVATIRQYREVLNSEFNIAFFNPKKDRCEICAAYEMGDATTKSAMQQKHDLHLANKSAARSRKDKDKDLAVNDKSVCAACFDLQKVLATPQSEVSTFYYKSKLATYNFTVYDMGNNEGYCYVWNEQIAKRGPNEIASCLLLFLKVQKEKGVKKVILYSDNCGGQNRNRFIFSMFSHVSKFMDIEIIHRFLKKGHTQNEGDSMHAVIENSKKRQSAIYTPDQWVMLIRMAKVTGTPYNVKEMSQNDFYSFVQLVKSQNWLKDENGDKVKISHIREVRVSPEQPEIVIFKYGYEDEQKSLLIRRVRRNLIQCQDELPRLYHDLLPIDKKKLKGLLELCENNSIPKLYHSYYNSLQTNQNENQAETAEYDGPDETESSDSDSDSD